MHTANSKRGESHVVIHSSGLPFSDENVTVVIGYLISRYLYTFEKAFETVNTVYQHYK